MPPGHDTRSPFDELALQASAGSPGLARATLKVQTELFLQQAPAETDNEPFLSLALTLLPMVDERTAREMAMRLAGRDEAPAALIEALYARGGGVAEAIIEGATRLKPALRRDAAAHTDPRLAAKLAVRPDLEDMDQLELLGRNEPAVSLALAQNHAITLQRAVASGLMTAARRDPLLAQALLERTDVDIVGLSPLYPLASAEQRLLMREAIGRRIVERSIAPPHREASLDEQARLMDVSLEGVAALVSEIAAITERDAAFVAAATVDSSREIVGLALLALAIKPEDATRMILRTGDAVAQDAQAVHSVVGMLRSTSRATADMILAACWPHGAWRTGQHVPAMAPGGNTSRPPAIAARKPGAAQLFDRIRRVS
jgi:hypothetical protein